MTLDSKAEKSHKWKISTILKNYEKKKNKFGFEADDNYELIDSNVDLKRKISHPYMQIEKYDEYEKTAIGHNSYPIIVKTVYGYNYRVWYYYYYYYYSLYYYNYCVYYNNYIRIRRYIYDYYIKQQRSKTVDLGTEYLDTVNISVKCPSQNNDKLNSNSDSDKKQN